MTAYDLITDYERTYYPQNAQDALQRARRAVEELRVTVAALERERDDLRESLHLALALLETSASDCLTIDDPREIAVLLCGSVQWFPASPPHSIDDVLWVQEAFAVRRLQAGLWLEWQTGENKRVPDELTDEAESFVLPAGAFHPAASMPHWASRLTVRVVEVGADYVTVVQHGE